MRPRISSLGTHPYHQDQRHSQENGKHSHPEVGCEGLRREGGLVSALEVVEEGTQSELELDTQEEEENPNGARHCH